MQILDWILGRQLASREEEEQRIGVWAGIPLLGLDALSSCAYGPEAALTVLLPLGMMGLHYILPISGAVLLLLWVLYFSYRQTIGAYPTGGGSYTVAKENLGRFAGGLAAAALLLDYILTVAVGISAGVGAIISAIPSLQNHVLGLGLVILCILTIVNLRGIKESGVAFMLPTYAFIVSILGVMAYGAVKVILAHGHPLPVESIPVPAAAPAIPVAAWLILRAFASGCTAMTGVEAVSNGVKAFREPVAPHAQRTLTFIIAVLALLLAGIVLLSYAYNIGATAPDASGYESMVSQMLRAIVGRGVIYYFCITSVTAVLAFSANTAFADFPRLCQILAKDNMLPHAFSLRGRRLVFTHGILVLSAFTAALLIYFGGITDNLIPLYAIGAFLAFTLSQAGMVVHWKKVGIRQHRYSIAINFFGAVATGITLCVVLASKFAEGGWVTVVLIPLALMVFYSVKRHYGSVARQLNCDAPLDFNRKEPLVVIPVRGWSVITRKALQFATQISSQVYAVHVEDEDVYAHDTFDEDWERFVLEPARKAGKPAPELIKVKNPYRRLFFPFFQFINELESRHPNRKITVVVPQLAEQSWYGNFFYNQRSVLLTAAIYFRRDKLITYVTIPWYLDKH